MAVGTLGSASRAKVPPWNDPVVRGWVFQIVVVGLVGLLAWFLISNTLENLARQKIASGFSYLGREAGFEIGDSMIRYTPADTYGRAILVGLLNTLKVAVLGIILATIFGTLLGVGRLSPNWLLAKLCEYYVEIFRNVPLLLWLFLIYKMISEAFPGPRQAINVLDSFFLSNRGLYFPVPLADPIHEWMGVGLLVGIAAAVVLQPLGAEAAAGGNRPTLPHDLGGLRPGPGRADPRSGYWAAHRIARAGPRSRASTSKAAR